MNIEELLRRCSYATVDSYNEQTHTYHILKYSKPCYEIDKCYLVKVSGDIVNNSNSLMATNWNQGRSPAKDYLKIYISKKLGQNIYVDSVGYDFINKIDLDYVWSGWLNIKDLELISKM